MAFRYAPEVLDAFPTTRGGVILASGLANGPSSAGLTAAFEGEQHRVRERLGDTPLSSLASLAAWRRVFSAFGSQPTRYRNAAEALLRRLTKRGSIPSINTLVDAANLVSIRHALPVAVFDRAGIAGTTTVRFADGSERFTDLGAIEAVRPEAGEVVFVDDAGEVAARRWCWRQSDGSAARESTTDALITVESQHDDTGEAVAGAAADLIELLRAHQPDASAASTVLGPGRPAL
jgi:DNA/RNA-binding domain of Phe-tRNA-synthetase-like protein